MYQPRKSILEMFDPLMVNPPSTPKREESDASPDNSDKENDAPRDPLSLSQYFNRTYHVKGLQQQFTPKGKLIDLGDISIGGESEVTSLGSSGVATEVQPGNGDILRPLPPTTDPYGDCDAEPATSSPSNGPFATPQNRRILGDIDVDELRPPKPPMKQGALKISFLAVPTSGSPPTEDSTTTATRSSTEPDNTVPVITLYPPTFDSIPPTSSAPQISDKIDDYLSPQLPLSRTTTFNHRRNLLPSEHTSNRVSMDLQSSFELQLQNGDYSFNLINDKVSFLESSQELSFPESDDDSDTDQIMEDVSVEDMLKSLTLQDKETVAAKQTFTPTAENFSITSTSEKNAELSSKSETLRDVTPVSVSPSQGIPDTCATTAAPSVTRGLGGLTHHPSTASRSSIPGPRSVATTSKPPMRVLIPPTKRPSSISSAQRTSVVRPPGRQSSAMGTLPKPVAALTGIAGKPTDGPRRVLVQASDKPTSQPVPTRNTSVPKVLGPQRVLVRAVPTTTNPIKKPLTLSSSANPPALASRLPGPSRIAVPSNHKPAIKTSSIPKPAGRWV